MPAHTRTITIERTSVDVEAGTFEACVFSGGEASDGHVLDIAGGKLPKEMPLFVNHAADPRTQLGVLMNPSKTDDEVLYRGQILTEGEGPEAAIRRDILLKMSRGMVRSMSGRWDADEKDVVRRVNLPSDHPAFVDDKATGAKRWGLFFKRWTAREGSIVGLGADPAAVMRWAEEAEQPEVAQFWRTYAAETPAAAEPTREGMLAAFAAQVRELVEHGIDPAELRAELPADEIMPADDADEDATAMRIAELERRLQTIEEARAVPVANDPTAGALSDGAARRHAPIRAERIADEVKYILDVRDDRILDAARKMIDEARGRIG